MITRCPSCGKEFKPRSKGKKGFQIICSVLCQRVWQKQRHRGDKNPRWQGGTTRWKTCRGCGKEFYCNRYIEYINRKFCSQKCGWLGQNNGRRGRNNPNWRGGISAINHLIRTSKEHKDWSKQVLIRDNYTCQSCTQRGGDLHAHHILEFSKFPIYRFILENGIVLCLKCHYLTYKFHSNQFRTASSENGVNSENIPEWGKLRAKLLDEISQKKGVTVRNERIAIISTNAPPERDDMT